MGTMRYVAIGEDHPNYFDNVLSNDIITYYEKIKKYLTDEWKNQNKQNSLLEIRSCLDKLSSVIFQINRLYNHHKDLLKNITNFVDNENEDLVMSIDINEACYDFEALLLHSRSTLDRLTRFVSKTKRNSSPTNSFKNLRDFIDNNLSKEESKDQLLCILNECAWIEDFMITKDNQHRSVRDSIAHYSSFNDKTEYCFNIIKMNKNEVVVTDMESYDIPLFQTTWQLTYYLPFLLINFLSHYTINQKLELSKCLPKWKNMTIIISKYLEGIDNTSLTSNVIRLCKYFRPDGFTLRTDNYTNDLSHKKLLISKIPPRKKEDKLKEGFTEVAVLKTNFLVMVKQENESP